ncbi:MAG: hypothetical protein CL623_02015 [Arcobacter sp.]|nr:hypothetical protein [Arcobacter sp.]|tara:strand:+ start:11831 stop:12040 length:210 start_codon:yes stop_codon:yes gene_type:complete
MKNADLPAMPFEGGNNNGIQPSTGLTKREMFAMHAMQGIIAYSSHALDRGRAARSATEFADALLKELDK